MKKINTFFLLFLVSTLSVFAQEDEKTNQKILTQAPYIFKGTVISETPFKGEHERDFLISYVINIETIYKGKQLNIGTIRLISESRLGWSESEGYIIPDIVSEYTPEEQNKFKLGVGISGVFVCNQYNNKLVKIPESNTEINNTINIEPVCATKNCFYLFKYYSVTDEKTRKVTEKYYVEGFGKTFDSLEDFTNFLSKINLTPQKETVKKKDATFLEEKKQNEILYNQRIKNYKERQAILEQRYQNSLLNKIGTTNKANDVCKEFFISEYTDGLQKNKVIEIFNPSDSVKSLNGYSIKIFNNGAPTPLDIPLSGNVNPKETYVVTHPQADPQVLSKAHQTDVKMNFDGNDAIVLNKGTSTYIDKIGEIGVNPGVAGWNVPPGASTKAQDLRRKHPIDQGETDWNQGKNQWDAFPQDSLGNIKQHQNICSAGAIEDITFEIANEQVTGSSPQFYEFDILVSGSSSNTYIDNTAFVVEYNTIPFGSNIVFNNKVTITLGTNYNTSTYEDPMSGMTDDAANAIRFHVGTDFGASS